MSVEAGQNLAILLSPAGVGILSAHLRREITLVVIFIVTRTRKSSPSTFSTAGSEDSRKLKLVGVRDKDFGIIRNIKQLWLMRKSKSFVAAKQHRVLRPLSVPLRCLINLVTLVDKLQDTFSYTVRDRTSFQWNILS